MSVSSSFFADIPPPPPDLPSNSSSLHPLTNMCFRSKMNIYIFSALSIASVLPLPVSFVVLYLGYQQWRKQSSTSKARSHSDLLTYHSIIMQLSEYLGLILLFCGGYNNLPEMVYVGFSTLSGSSLGQACFQILTCVEHYLAVVHPIIYLGLRQASGFRIRNITIGYIWLQCFVWMAVSYLTSSNSVSIMYSCGMVFFIIVVCFSSIAVLRTLKRPGPGEVGGKRERVDQSKQKAFKIIMAIMGVLLFTVMGNVIPTVMYKSSVLNDMCLLIMSITWFNLPSSLMLPLLFLHRAGKLTRRKQNTESG